MSTVRSNVEESKNEKILWSCISRNETILVEAGEDPYGGAVTETAVKILTKKKTPGWEYVTLRLSSGSRRKDCPKKLKAIKFHVYEHSSGHWDIDEDMNEKAPLVWVFAAVYNPAKWIHSRDAINDVQNFIQKIVGLTLLPRLDDMAWRSGITLACQTMFAPTLFQRMQQVTSHGKLARVEQSPHETTNLMQSNITAIFEIEEQEQRNGSSKWHTMASTFQKNTQAIRRRIMLQNAKHGVILGTTTATVALFTAG